MRLAHQSGEWDVDALMARVSHRDLSEWMAYWMLDADAAAGRGGDHQELTDWRQQRDYLAAMATGGGPHDEAGDR